MRDPEFPGVVASPSFDPSKVPEKVQIAFQHRFLPHCGFVCLNVRAEKREEDYAGVEAEGIFMKPPKLQSSLGWAKPFQRLSIFSETTAISMLMWSCQL